MTDAAIGEDPHSEQQDEEARDRGSRHRRHVADALHQAGERVAEPSRKRPPGLHAEPELVVETDARPRRRERVVQLTLERLQLELVVLFAHTPSFCTASFNAFSAR